MQACPPSTWYWLSKTARRNRTALSAAGVVAVAVALGTAATLWQASAARADRERANKAENDRIQADAVAAAKLKAQEDILIAERRQNALDRAIEAAFNGDLEKTRKAIIAAQQVGVDAHQVYWLNGLVHFQRGDHEAAIKEFHASLELKKTAAALGMLARAEMSAALSGSQGLEGFFRARAELNTVTPVSPEDYMCRGFAHPLANVPRSIADLNEAIRQRDTPIARAFGPLPSI